MPVEAGGKHKSGARDLLSGSETAGAHVVPSSHIGKGWSARPGPAARAAWDCCFWTTGQVKGVGGGRQSCLHCSRPHRAAPKSITPAEGQPPPQTHKACVRTRGPAVCHGNPSAQDKLVERRDACWERGDKGHTGQALDRNCEGCPGHPGLHCSACLATLLCLLRSTLPTPNGPEATIIYSA